MLKHIAVGLLIPYSIFLCFYAKRRFCVETKLLARMSLILLCCGIWSVLPTIVTHLSLGFVGKISNNFLVSNVFFFYGILRKVPAGGATWGLGAVYFVFFSLIVIFTRHLGMQEKKIMSLCKAKDGK
jgi:hypothetical protein